MNSGLNTLIENLHQKLINDINNCQLPVGIIYYVAKDLFKEIEIGYQNALKDEMKEALDNSEKEE